MLGTEGRCVGGPAWRSQGLLVKSRRQPERLSGRGGRELAWEGGGGAGDSHRCYLNFGLGCIWGRAMLSNICGTVE